MYIPVFRVPQLVTEHKQASKMKVNQIECTNKTYRPPKLLISGQTSTEHKFLKGKPWVRNVFLSAKRLHS